MIRGIAAVLLVSVTAVACSSGSRGATSSPGRSPTAAPSAVSTEWTEYHRDAGRSGVGSSAPGLNHPQVAWNVSVDGDVYASPLIVNGHVIIATENNTVYSLDIFTGTPIWTKHLGDPVDARSLPCGNIAPWTGITGTPAVDPSSHRLYVVAYLAGRHHVLYALSLVDGSVAWSQDIDPPGSIPAVQQLRGALAIGSGFVYVPFGGLFGDCGAYHGYVIGVPLSGGVARTYVVPAARGAGIWAPAGPTIGPDGSVYVVTGNATSGGFGYRASVVQLAPDLASVRSYFAPSNWAALNASDTDLGSAGVALLPSLGRAVVVGKEGVAYLLSLGDLGGVGGQIASRKVCSGAWGGTAWLDSTVFVPCADGLFALGVSASSIQTNWFVGHPTLGSPIISAGAVWAIDSSSATLYALDPADGRNVLYSIGLGSAHHFSTPAATDGFVVAPAGQKVVAIAVVGS